MIFFESFDERTETPHLTHPALPGTIHIQKRYEKGIQFLLVMGNSVVGNLWLDGDVYYQERKYIGVKMVMLNPMVRGQGYAKILYQTALAHLDDYAGICSKMSEWENKKQVPKIYKSLGAHRVRFRDEDGVSSSYQIVDTP